ncbi:MAG: NAD(+)/NADH kinase [Actinobacteria bacterium]|nr:NAD(+)/NADH kinase [Actinomycetota bacterium]
MSSFGFLLHGERELARTLGADLARWLLERDHEVRFLERDAKRVGFAALAFDEAEFASGLDLIVGIGGDGTMLDAAELGDGDVPVLGINVGQLGYLTAVEPEQAHGALKRFLAGAYSIEDRMRIAATLHRTDGTVEALPFALNEVLVERAELGHTIRVDVALDAAPFTPYVADAIILATPTGSTAYAFSARGPIIDPRMSAQVLVPVAPHMLFDRALVLAPSTEIRLTIAGSRPAHVSIDGHSGEHLEAGDFIVCTAADSPARLIRFPSPNRHHHTVLKAKFALPDR